MLPCAHAPLGVAGDSQAHRWACHSEVLLRARLVLKTLTFGLVVLHTDWSCFAMGTQGGLVFIYAARLHVFITDTSPVSYKQELIPIIVKS